MQVIPVRGRAERTATLDYARQTIQSVAADGNWVFSCKADSLVAPWFGYEVLINWGFTLRTHASRIMLLREKAVNSREDSHSTYDPKA